MAFNSNNSRVTITYGTFVEGKFKKKFDGFCDQFPFDAVRINNDLVRQHVDSFSAIRDSSGQTHYGYLLEKIVNEAIFTTQFNGRETTSDDSARVEVSFTASVVKFGEDRSFTAEEKRLIENLLPSQLRKVLGMDIVTCKISNAIAQS